MNKKAVLFVAVVLIASVVQASYGIDVLACDLGLPVRNVC